MPSLDRLLLDDLVEYNSPKRYDIVVVFDSAGTGSRSDHVESYLGLGVVFTPSADLYIEQELRRIAAEGQRPVWAATADRAIQVAATNYGANVMSTKRLVEELKGSRAASATRWNDQGFQLRSVVGWPCHGFANSCSRATTPKYGDVKSIGNITSRPITLRRTSSAIATGR